MTEEVTKIGIFDGITGRSLGKEKVSSGNSLLIGSTGEKISLENFSQNKFDECFVFPLKFSRQKHEKEIFRVESSFTQNLTSGVFDQFKIKKSKENDVNHIKRLTKKENELMTIFYKQCAKHHEKGEQYHTEFVTQCKSLIALFRHQKTEVFGEFQRFIDVVIGHFNKFIKEKQKLTKKTADKIYDELLEKSINSDVSFFSSGRGKDGKLIKKKKVGALTDFVSFGGSGERGKEKIEILEDNFHKVKVYEEKVSDTIKSLSLLFQSFVKKVIKCEKNDPFLSEINQHLPKPVLKNGKKKEEKKKEDQYYDKFKDLRGKIGQKLENLKECLEDHSRNVENLQGLEENDITCKTILLHLKQKDYPEKFYQFDKDITGYLFQLSELKYKKDVKFREYFKVLLDDRSILEENRTKHSVDISNFTASIINHSLKQLIFAQNLPIVYDNCLEEVLRRSKFVDSLKINISEVNSKMDEYYSTEIEKRAKFIKRNEDLLGGYRIPEGLVAGVTDNVKQNKVSVEGLGINIPDTHLVGKLLESAFELLGGDDGFKESNEDAAILQGKIKSKIQMGETILVEERETKKLQDYSLDELHKKFFPKKKKVSQDVLPQEGEVVQFNPHRKKILELEEKLEKLLVEKDTLNRKVKDLTNIVQTTRVEKTSIERDLKAENVELVQKFAQEKRTLIKEKDQAKLAAETCKKELEMKIIETNQNAQRSQSQQVNAQLKSMQTQLQQAWAQKKNADKLCEAEKKKTIGVQLAADQKYNKLVEKQKKEELMIVKNVTELTKKIQGYKAVIQPILDKNEQLQAKTELLQKHLNQVTSVVKASQDGLTQYKNRWAEAKNQYTTMKAKHAQLQTLTQRQSSKLDEYEKQNRGFISEISNLKKQGKVYVMPTEKYKKDLASLKTMGFDDTEYNIYCLMKCKGVLDQAVAMITKEFNTSTIQRKVPQNMAAVFDFKYSQRVVFFRRDAKLWEIFNWKRGAMKYYLHPTIVASMKKKSTTCMGSIWSFWVVDAKSKDNILKQKVPYTVVILKSDINQF